MTSDKQSNARRTSVESKSNRSCNRRLKQSDGSCLPTESFQQAKFLKQTGDVVTKFCPSFGSVQLRLRAIDDGVDGAHVSVMASVTLRVDFLDSDRPTVEFQIRRALGEAPKQPQRGDPITLIWDDPKSGIRIGSFPAVIHLFILQNIPPTHKTV